MVVELGCGTGLYTRAYAPQCSQAIATDISEPMIELAQRALASSPNVSVRIADATSTGLPTGSADAVVTVNLLHIVSDAAAVLAEARRLLRPGGMLVVADATGKGLSVRHLLASIWRIVRRWGLMPQQKGQQNLTQASLEVLVQTVGFESIEGHPLTGELMNAAFVRAVRSA
jgi:ubiquinone/menaquinone biosynthesis C-methylase UbiE